MRVGNKKTMWWVGGALLVGLVAATRALRFEIDIDPWREDALGW